MAFELALRGEPIRTGQASPIVKTVETVKTVSVDSRCRNCQTVSPPSDFSPGPLSPAGRCLVLLLWASCFNNSFINMAHWNLTFFLINCSSTLSPSGLMAVRFFRSRRSSQP
jgi:hypothetical protein